MEQHCSLGISLVLSCQMGVRKASECSELVSLMASFEKLAPPFWCVDNAITVQGSCAPWVKMSETTDLTGTSSQDDKCQQGTASDTGNKPLHNGLNWIKIKGKSICLFLHPNSYLSSSWPIFICCVGRHWTTLHFQVSEIYLFCYVYSWKKTQPSMGLYISELEISIPKGPMVKKTEPPSSIAWKLSSPKPALQKAHPMCSPVSFSKDWERLLLLTQVWKSPSSQTEEIDGETF